MSPTNAEALGGIRLDIAFGTGFVLESGTYCIYTCLFLAALPMLANAKRRQDANSRKAAWVLLTSSVLMFVVATLHLVLEAFRFYKSIFLNIDPKGPVSYLRNLTHWEYLGALSLVCIQTWLGDALVIYRCYVVWNRILWFISIPICLLLSQIGLDLATLYLLRHPSSLFRKQAHSIRNSLYLLPFAQNFITTSLIILKIWLQHRASKKAGIVDMASKLSLIRIVRIVIESAAIYTVEVFVLLILTFRHNNAQYIVQGAVPSSIGINFVLLAIRIGASRNERIARSNKDIQISSLLPRWAPHSDSDNSSGDYGNFNSLRSGDGNNAIDHKADCQEQSVAVQVPKGQEEPTRG